MEDLNKEKSDVVAVILDDRDLLNIFAETLKVENKEDFSLINISMNSISRFQTVRFYFWKKIKNILVIVSTKIQTLAVLAEYHFKNEEKKFLNIMKKD